MQLAGIGNPADANLYRLCLAAQAVAIRLRRLKILPPRRQLGVCPARCPPLSLALDRSVRNSEHVHNRAAHKCPSPPWRTHEVRYRTTCLARRGRTISHRTRALPTNPVGIKGSAKPARSARYRRPSMRCRTPCGRSGSAPRHAGDARPRVECPPACWRSRRLKQVILAVFPQS
jgi:hypothetical protein